MFNKITESWIFKGYMKLPLWGKVAVPIAALFLISSIFKLFKVALILGVVGVVAYFLLKIGGGKKGE